MTVAGVLWERESVLAGAGRVLDGAAAGRAGSLFLIGDAGLGKTSALEHACGLAEERDFVVGVGRGNVMESALPLGVVAQAFDSLGGREVFEQLGDAPPGPDARAARFYAARRWLERFHDVPVLLALDDLHWADADSLALMSFLCRRLRSLSVAVVGALRPYPRSAVGVAIALAHDGHASVERLEPLTETAAGELLAARVGRHLGDDAIVQAWDACAGNPLLLEQVALAIGRGEDVPGPAKAGSSVSEELLLARFAGLPAVGMRCAQAAAVFGTRFRPELAIQLAQLSDTEADSALDALVRSGLVRQAQAGGADFVHPLFRQALYEDLGGPSQARMHGRAFALLRARGLDAEAAEHALRADLAGDAEAAALLARVGCAALRSGARETAITLLEAGMELAREPADAELLLDFAEALFQGGRLGETITVCESVLDRAGLTPMIRARALRALAQGLYYTGNHDAATARFEESAELAKIADPEFAVHTLISYAQTCWFAMGPTKALPVTVWAREIARACDAAVRRRADAMWGVIALETGDPEGLEVCTTAARAVEADPVTAAAEVGRPASVLISYAFAARYAERLADSERCLRAGVRAVHDAGNVQDEASFRAVLADTLIRRLRIEDARNVVERCAELSDLMPLAEPFAGVGRALISLLVGRAEESDDWADRVEPVITAIGAWSASLWLLYTRGWRRLAEGRFDEACELYTEMEATALRVGMGEPCEVPWAGHAIAAFVANGRNRDAERVIEWLESCAGPLPCRWPRVTAAIGRARLAESVGDHDTADQLFQRAMDLHQQVDLPLERFQTLLEYGRYLRRAGQIRRARPLLADALALAEASGAAWLSGQAGDELRIAGGRRRRREDPSRLTAQEQRVAALAASGASTPEIARQLYVSASTIETHLEHVYTKFGIHSRRELMHMRDAIGTEITDGRTE